MDHVPFQLVGQFIGVLVLVQLDVGVTVLEPVCRSGANRRLNDL